MAEFFKTLLKGVIYVVLLPFILLGWALEGVYCVFVFIYMAIRNLIIFFAGGSPMGDLPEDVKAKKILAERLAQPQPSYVGTPFPTTPSAPTMPVEEPEQNYGSSYTYQDNDSVSPLNEEEQPNEGGDDDGNFTQTY